ncbi:MAG: tetratricopeptide repeat protein [Bacteroidetes bacterium]|nr:MAG: tetratricopeptide repeat protein [Bacteroidota bacterium]
MKRKNLKILAWVSTLGMVFLFSTCTGDTEAERGSTASVGGTLEQLNKEIADNPTDAELYALRAEYLYDEGDFDQAIADMQKALTLDSVNLDYHHLLADIYLDYYRSRLALQTMERAAALAPEDVFTLLKLSEIQLYLKQNQASLITLDKVLRQDPHNALAFFFMGRNFEDLGQTNRAINSYQEASENDPEMLDAWLKLGQLHASINGSLAAQFYDNAIEVDSAGTLALQAKAEYLWDQQDLEGALDLYRQAALKKPLESSSFYNAGLVYLELDSLVKAREHFNIAIQNDPAYVNAYYYRGYAAEALGQKEQARRDYEQVLRLAPEHEDAQRALARLATND